VTPSQVLILYRDIIRTARIMTHKDNGAPPPTTTTTTTKTTGYTALKASARPAFAMTCSADGVPWSLKLISHARAEIEDARGLRDSEVGPRRCGGAFAFCPPISSHTLSLNFVVVLNTDYCTAAHHGP
jgi:hypothetical protein